MTSDTKSQNDTQREEFVPDGRAIWQSETASSYRCPTCGQLVRTQYDGDALPRIECHGFMAGHTVRWGDAP